MLPVWHFQPPPERVGGLACAIDHPAQVEPPTLRDAADRTPAPDRHRATAYFTSRCQIAVVATAWFML